MTRDEIPLLLPHRDCAGVELGVAKHGLELNVTDEEKYPSWYVWKP